MVDIEVAETAARKARASVSVKARSLVSSAAHSNFDAGEMFRCELLEDYQAAYVVSVVDDTALLEYIAELEAAAAK